MRRNALATKLVVLRFAWSPLDLELTIETGAELGAIDPRSDRRRAKRARLGTLDREALRVGWDIEFESDQAVRETAHELIAEME